MKRREFLTSAVVLADAAFAPRALSAQYRPAPCPVHLLALSGYGGDIEKEIASIMRADGLVLKGRKVLLKPNFVEAHPERPINTHPSVIAGVAHACLRMGAAQVTVGEASGHRRDPWFSVLNPGLRGALDKAVKCVDMNYGDAVSISNKSGLTRLPTFQLAKAVAEADFLISLPKMKTHHWAGVTLSLKNLFGTLPGVYYGWPKNILHYRGIERSIVDLATTVKIDYAIIDGVVGMQGDGPIMGTSKPVGVLVLSPFPLAADATAARLMGFDPFKVPSLAQAGRFLRGLGTEDVRILGEDPKRFATRFECLEEFKAAQCGPFF